MTTTSRLVRGLAACALSLAVLADCAPGSTASTTAGPAAASIGSPRGDVKLKKSWYGTRPGRKTPGWNSEFALVNTGHGPANYSITAEYRNKAGRVLGSEKVRTGSVAASCLFYVTFTATAVHGAAVREIHSTVITGVQRIQAPVPV